MTPKLARRLVAPNHHTEPEYLETYGPEVGDVCALAGFPPDPEQAMILDTLFAIVGGGKVASFEVDVIAPRQNLKTGLVKQAELGWLFVTEERLIVHSAHEMSTTEESFLELAILIENTPALSRRLRPDASGGIHRGNGKERIELDTGQRIKFKARTKGGGRGLTGDRVVLDEGYALQASHMGSLLPTLAAVPNPQVLIASSAGKVESAVLRDARDRGRAGTSPRQAYFEWGDPNAWTGCESEDCLHEKWATGCALDDEDRWTVANPALGRRITLDTLRSMRQAMPPAEFAREFLCWWDDPGVLGDVAIDADQWRNRHDAEAMPDKGTPVRLAVAVSPDRHWGSIGVASRSAGKILPVVSSSRSQRWLVEELVRLAAKHGTKDVSLDPSTQAGPLVPHLEKAGLTVDKMAARDVAAACGAWLNAVEDGSLVHLAQAELDTAVSVARTRNYGESLRWETSGTVDVSPLVAASLAAHRLTSTGTQSYDPLDSVLI